MLVDVVHLSTFAFPSLPWLFTYGQRKELKHLQSPPQVVGPTDLQHQVGRAPGEALGDELAVEDARDGPVLVGVVGRHPLAVRVVQEGAVDGLVRAIEATTDEGLKLSFVFQVNVS